MNHHVGSSPLTRGKRPGRRVPDPPPGLIPAHAGKTCAIVGLPVAVRAHPRSRGENDCSRSAAALTAGSSPLTRGKRSTAALRSRRPRLIPAHAGKTKQQPTPALTTQAHPRSRGENSAKGPNGEPAEGSSPLTRGKPRNGSLSTSTPRLIPAHAGKTRLHYASRAMYRAHPRSRGENIAHSTRADTRMGSSPLTRGKLYGSRDRAAHPGLIPAHAGKTVTV